MKKLFAILVLLAIAAGATFWAAQSYLPMRLAKLPEAGLTLNVPRGASVNRVVADLAKQEVAPAWQLQLMSRVRSLTEGDAKIRAGQYLFTAPKTLGEIFDALESGAAIQLPITVVEGTTQRELFAQMKKLLSEQKLFRADTVVAPDQWAKAVGAETANLEGYLFPDTYLV
ncbi:MAG: endolytic transglycosylase MltG, partial [Casimicrobium sp.]